MDSATALRFAQNDDFLVVLNANWNKGFFFFLSRVRAGEWERWIPAFVGMTKGYRGVACNAPTTTSPANFL